MYEQFRRLPEIRKTNRSDEKGRSNMAKILIIDDDPDILTAVRMSLEPQGYEVVEARSGKEGIEVLKNNTPDLIILDVMMETKTEGFQLALKLRSPDPGSEYANFKDIPILMLTAIHSTTPLKFEPDIDYLPVELFVDKPIDPDDLVNKVDYLLTRETV
jgi:CheY-like chemotaxis protein